MTGISGKTTGSVWLVWDGLGGHVFEVCNSKRSAAVVRKHYRRWPNLVVIKFDMKDWQDWKC